MTITEQVLDLAPDATIAGQIAGAPGIAVQALGLATDDAPALNDTDDAPMLTAHRLDDTTRHLAHATQRMQAAREATGKLRQHHAAHIARHLQAALDATHDLAANIRAHYPAEAAELEQVKQTIGLAWDSISGQVIGLARAVSGEAKAATTSHLLETTLHELTHGSRHAQAMTEPTPDAEWEFNADHAEKHLAGAVEHAGKLRQHLKDNYPTEAGHLAGLDEITSGAGQDGKQQHAQYAKGGTISAQMANPAAASGQAGVAGRPKAGTISGQLNLSAATSRAKAHATAHSTASATARLHALEHRDERGRFADSLAAHTPPDGTLDPERAALHRKIIDGILAGHQPQAHPVATFLGGGPASGKSTVMKGASEDTAHIDPDAIKEQLPEYKQMVAAGDQSAAAYAHEESSHIAKQAMRQAQDKRLNYTLDGTGDSDIGKLAGKVDDAKRRGYATEGRYVTVDTDEAVKRAMRRAQKTGRLVPESVIREIHSAVSGTYDKAARAGLFDKTELFDNNGPQARRIAHKDPGGKFTVDDSGAYQRFLAKGQQGAG